jgi:hypothetical protein
MGSRRPWLEAPRPGWLGTEDDIQGEQTVAACHEQRDAIARQVLFEPLIEPVRARQ